MLNTKHIILMAVLCSAASEFIFLEGMEKNNELEVTIAYDRSDGMHYSSPSDTTKYLYKKDTKKFISKVLGIEIKQNELLVGCTISPYIKIQTNLTKENTVNLIRIPLSMFITIKKDTKFMLSLPGYGVTLKCTPHSHFENTNYKNNLLAIINHRKNHPPSCYYPDDKDFLLEKNIIAKQKDGTIIHGENSFNFDSLIKKLEDDHLPS